MTTSSQKGREAEQLTPGFDASRATAVPFRPRYKLMLWLSIVVMAAMAVSYWLFRDELDSPWITLCFALIMFVVCFMPFAIIREIRFDDHIRIRRFGLPDQVFSYSDVKDIGETGISLPGTNVDFTHMKNAGELRAMAERLVASGRIPESQLQGKRHAAEKSSERAELASALLFATLVIGLHIAGRHMDEGTEKVLEATLTILAATIFGIARWRRSRRSEAVRQSVKGPDEPDGAGSAFGANDVERYMTWVGPNWTSHYAMPFAAMMRDYRRAGWNWAAALFPPWWVYRRRYGVFFAIIALDALLSLLLSDPATAWTALDAILVLVLLASVVFLGSLGDYAVFRRGHSFLIGEGARARPDEVAAHGRPNLPLGVCAGAFWIVYSLFV